MDTPTPQPDTVLVRCSKQMLVDMVGNGMSEPIVLIGITAQEDGTHDLVLQRPSRAVLQAAIMDRFRS